MKKETSKSKQTFWAASREILLESPHEKLVGSGQLGMVFSDRIPALYGSQDKKCNVARIVMDLTRHYFSRRNR